MGLKLVLDLVLLLAMLATTAVALAGWGNLTWRLLGIDLPNKPSVLTVWLGFCVVVGCLEIVHLFLPIAWQLTFAVAIVGVLAQVCRAKLQSAVDGCSVTERQVSIGFLNLTINTLRRHPLHCAIAAIIILVWCLRAMQTPTMYDSGLYHFGSIRWLNEYAIVPGLGNLHWRLALNQSYFGFLALLNIAPYWGRGYASGGLFLLLLTAFTLLEVGITRTALWRWIFGGILFSYLCLLSGMISNPLPDTAVTLLQIAIFIFLYCSLTIAAQSEPTSRDKLKRLQVVLVFLCLTIVTIKLSSLGFAGATVAIVFALMLRSSSEQLPLKFVLIIVAVTGFVALVHVGRSYLLSGAPFFPSPFGGVWSLPWAVEFGVAHNESQLIYAWAKQPGIMSPSEVPAGYAWLGPWLSALPPTLKYLFVVSSFLFLVASIWRCFYSSHLTTRYLLLAVPIFAALGFWFFSAPDPRFLGATVVLYFVWSLWFFCISLTNFAQHRGGGIAKALTTFNYFSAICVLLLFIRWSLGGLLLPTGWGALPVAETTLQASLSGLKVFVPSNGSQCWNTELPCAVLLHGGLLKVPLDQFGWLFSLQAQRFGFFIQR